MPDYPKDSPSENALYVFNRLVRMSTEDDLSTWKQNQVRNFLRHDQVDEILELSDDFGRTILDNACISGNLRFVQLLLPKNAKMHKARVTMALVCAHIHVLDYLLTEKPEYAETEVVYGVDITETMPLLNYCAKIGNERALSVILRHAYQSPESIVTSLDKAGNTPLHNARKEEVAAMLLKRAGDLSVLKVTNKRGQVPIQAVMERFNTVQQSIKYGNNSDQFQIDSALLEKTIIFYQSIMKRNNNASDTAQPSGRVNFDADGRGRQVAAETMQSILQRRYNQILPPRRNNMNLSNPYSEQHFLSAVAARKRAMQQQQQRDRRFPRNMMGRGSTPSMQQQQQFLHETPFNQSYSMGEGACMDNYKKKMATMNRQERIKDTAIALTEYAREWDPIREQQQHQQQQQDFFSEMKMGNLPFPFKSHGGGSSVTRSTGRGHPIPHQLSSRGPAIPAESFRMARGGMRPASPLPPSIIQGVLDRHSPVEAGDSMPTSPTTTKQTRVNQRLREQHQLQRRQFSPR